MKWTVKFHDEFKAEFDELDQEVKNELLAEARFVEKVRPGDQPATRRYFARFGLRKHEGTAV